MKEDDYLSYEECHDLWEKEETKVHSDVSDELMSEIAIYISQKLQLQPEDKLLTIGCGDGYIDKFLIPKVKEFYAIDFSRQKLEEAKNKNQNGNYFLYSFLDSYYDSIKQMSGGGVNKIYSYSVMQYCRPEDVPLFLENQILCLNGYKDCIIAHLDVPDIKKSGIKNVSSYDGTKKQIYDTDGSYWHNLEIQKDMIRRHESVIEANVTEAHYWKDRSDLIIRVKGKSE